MFNIYRVFWNSRPIVSVSIHTPEVILVQKIYIDIIICELLNYKGFTILIYRLYLLTRYVNK